MRIRVSDHETTATVRGTRGPAVLLVHSLGLDRRMWDPVLDRLAGGRRVVAYDVRGHGSAAAAPLPFTMAATATDLVAVLDALDLDTAHVAGLSLGGAITQAAAVAAPERFASLTLMAAPDRPMPEAFEERARLAETGGMTPLIAPTLERWFTPEALAADTEGVVRPRVRRLVRSGHLGLDLAWLRRPRRLRTASRLPGAGAGPGR